METHALLPTLHAELIEWYWKHGRERKDGFALSPSTWLDRLYQNRDVACAIAHSRMHSKPCFALWGPSQAGKSTLLSSYLDAAADALGNGSALHWPGGEPARFDCNRVAGVTALNPYNQEGDATSCVCRFYLADEVPDPLHPVEIRLAAPTEMLHALAMGYWSECDNTLADGTQCYLDAPGWAARLAKYQAEAGAVTDLRSADRSAFEALQQLAELLETLILAGLPRYANLREGQGELRRQMLECPALLGSRGRVERFAAEVLWDSRDRLTALYERLRSEDARLRHLWRGKPVFCSLPVAALLLDIDSHKRYTQEAGDRNEALRALVHALSYQEQDDRIVIGRDHPRPLLERGADFGLFQGLVWELRIPLRKATLARTAVKFCEFLDQADLLDFPGVAQAHENTRWTRLDVDRLEPRDEHKLLTEVLKRGKTASVVAAYARNLTIDGFCLLNRIQRFPAQPGQLTTGIFTWWKYFDPEFRPDGRRRPSPLPLNLVLTFCAELVASVVQSGVRGGLEPVFERLKKLDVLADPAVLTHTLATNYAQFHAGSLPGSLAERQKALHEIMDDAAFRTQFRTEQGRQSFARMIADGGTDFLFSVLREQALGSARRELLARRERALDVVLRELLIDAVPYGTDENEQRKRAIREWRSRLQASLAKTPHGDVAAVISIGLRRLVNLDPETLDPIPLTLIRKRDGEIVAYLEKQFQNWIASKSRPESIGIRLADVGLRDSPHLVKVLHAMTEAVALEPLAQWTLANFGQLTSNDEARRARRYVAVKLANALLPVQRASHKSGDEVRTELLYTPPNEAAAAGHYARSPQYGHFVKPFLDYLEKLAEGGVTRGRPDQPGDREIVELLSKYPDFQAPK